MLMTNPNASCIGISNLKGAKFVVFAEVEIVCVSPSCKSTFGTCVFFLNFLGGFTLDLQKCNNNMLI